MPNSVYVGYGGTVAVDAAGALDGDGSSGSPLAVLVDNSTIQIVGNQLVAVGGGGGSDPISYWNSLLVDPTTQSWSWVNQGSATITEAHKYCQLDIPTSATDSVRMRVIDYPTPPFTIDVGFLWQDLNRGGDAYGCGLCLYDSVSQKFWAFVNYSYGGSGSGPGIAIDQWNNPLSFNSNKADFGSARKDIGGAFFQRFIDDNLGGRQWAWGINPVDFCDPVVSGGNTEFMTPNKIGFFAFTVTSHPPPALSVIHWKQS